MPKKKTKSKSTASQYGKSSKVQVEGSGSLPDRLKKADCLYLNGVISKQAHGVFHTDLENGMTAICTARRMANIKISLMLGDKVVVEIPTATLNPNEQLRGRIVWRQR